jgi:hypothetical protein
LNIEVIRISLSKAAVLSFCCLGTALSVAQEINNVKDQYIVVSKDNHYSHDLSVTANGESILKEVFND